MTKSKTLLGLALALALASAALSQTSVKSLASLQKEINSAGLYSPVLTQILLDMVYGLTPSLSTGTTLTLAGNSAYGVCTGACTVSLPPPSAGAQFCIINGDNVATVITLAALGSGAQYETTARTSYGTAGTGTMTSGGAINDKICLIGVDSLHYIVGAYNGTWTNS